MVSPSLQLQETHQNVIQKEKENTSSVGKACDAWHNNLAIGSRKWESRKKDPAGLLAGFTTP